MKQAAKSSSFKQDSLSHDEQKAILSLRACVDQRLKGDPALQLWCTDLTLIRYLRARSWDVNKANQMLHKTLDWRSSYKPHEITWAEVSEEATTGKLFRMHTLDREGRPVLVMRPRNENSNIYERRLKFLVYCLECASQIADESGVGRMTWLIDFAGYSLSNAPPVRMSMQTTSILQNHYPERLGLAVCYHPPIIFQVTWKACKPFVDPITKNKILFLDKSAGSQKLMAEKFDLAQLEECLGGSLPASEAFNMQTYGSCMQEEEMKRSQALQKLQLHAQPGNVTQLNVT
ncbi:hypothetical protein WJX74_007090 [Apatococcus lobatus]|uniref:CRAL-TRIO domain-containing protein n=1 Tax=Apatococcus lobatus TaxID=904363 RepID=A0AAW1SBV0_9CHLO